VAFDGSAHMEEEPFHAHASLSIAQAVSLEHALRREQFDQIHDLVTALNATCADCHRQYRD
jgi:cytochrome c556